jgi:hypothetical protein
VCVCVCVRACVCVCAYALARGGRGVGLVGACVCSCASFLHLLKRTKPLTIGLTEILVPRGDEISRGGFGCVVVVAVGACREWGEGVRGAVRKGRTL